MKKIFSIIILVLAISSALLAQQVPQGMKYQAVARNLKGEILANEKIVLRISLTSQEGKTAVVHYSELHNVQTNELGLFTLVIGEGVSNNAFKEIPWSTENIWMEVSIADKAKGGFTVISSSRLLAVPYAFHAETANKISGNALTQGNKEISGPTPSSPWTTKGNSGIMPNDYLGTSDDNSLIIKTNGLERMNVLNNGDVNVKGNVNLNTASGATINNGNLTVANLSATSLTGTLTVDKATNLNDELNVNNSKSTYLTGTLDVDKATNLNDILNVNNQKATYLSGSLTADGLIRFTDGTQSTSSTSGAMLVSGGAGIEKNLNVGGDLNVLNGISTLKNLTVDGVTGKSINISDNTTGYLATFENTNNGNGDGIKIKLGKEKPLTIPSVPDISTFFPGLSNALRNSIFTAGAFNTNLNLNTFITNVATGMQNDISGYVNLVEAGVTQLTNKVVDKINSTFENKQIWPHTVLYGGGSPVVDVLSLINGPIHDGICNSTGDCLVPDGWITPGDPSYVGTGTTIPEIAIPELKIPAIPHVTEVTFTNSLNFNFTAPSLSSNPLTKNNEFIGFFDNNGAKVGAIRGQSIQDFIESYTDVPHLITLVAAFVVAFDLDAGVPDPFSAVRIGARALDYYYNSWDKISKMGVEYSSGNGDYAEWLERQNPDEVIGTGDIVAVKGGKITKNLIGAEQIMAVSHRPIVLGNIPEKNKTELGNNIAFMGQIPVKVMGPVHAGDYIVAKSDVSGYGVAVNPENMKIEDYKLAVGRSWDTNENKGPKMVNTVVGVHNNGFLEIVKELQEKADRNEARLKTIEEKLNISSNIESKKEKKAFK